MVALMDTPRNAIAFTRGNVTYIGRWMVEDGMVTTWLGIHGPHCTQIGGMTPEVLAGLLLGELMDRAEGPDICTLGAT